MASLSQVGMKSYPVDNYGAFARAFRLDPAAALRSARLPRRQLPNTTPASKIVRLAISRHAARE